MKKSILFIISIISTALQSQIIKDSVLGKPKYMKEYVLFLNDSKPFQFMRGDSEYGHSVSIDPENLRSNMSDSWFGTDFCRYINSETYYLPNRKISKEVFYRSSGKLMVQHEYIYDDKLRVAVENVDYSIGKSHIKYFYKKEDLQPSFTELTSIPEDDFFKDKLFSNRAITPLTITKFNAQSKTDSIFTLTNQYWKNEDGKGFRQKTDSIYRPKLTQINFYNDQLQIKETRIFNFENNFRENKSVLSFITRFEYDDIGNLVKKIGVKDNEVISSTYYENGREVKNEDLVTDFVRHQVYNKEGILVERNVFSKGKPFFSIKYQFKDNHISKLYYYDPPFDKEVLSKPKEIIFKYKFDRFKNWTEIIKNVDGKDLYKWIREIQYYP